jgi:hypothetical protein
LKGNRVECSVKFANLRSVGFPETCDMKLTGFRDIDILLGYYTETGQTNDGTSTPSIYQVDLLRVYK